MAIGRFLENLFFSRKYSRNQIKCEKSKHINDGNNICVVVMFSLVLTPCIAYMHVDKKLRYCYILIELLVWPLESLRRTWFSIPTWKVNRYTKMSMEVQLPNLLGNYVRPTDRPNRRTDRVTSYTSNNHGRTMEIQTYCKFDGNI